MPRKITVQPINVVKAARVVTGAEIWVALILVLIGVIPLFLLIWFLHNMTPFKADEFIVSTLTGTFIFAVFETFAIILLWGLGRLELPEKFVHWLGAATIGEIATLLTIIVKHVFSK
ncbi:MAG: hypothetical protein ACJ71W_00390 [Terriglobales bacterium]